MEIAPQPQHERLAAFEQILLSAHEGGAERQLALRIALDLLVDVLGRVVLKKVGNELVDALVLKPVQQQLYPIVRFLSGQQEEK